MLAQVSAAELKNVYLQWTVSFLAAYGTVPYNDLHLLIESKVGLLSAPITAKES